MYFYSLVKVLQFYNNHNVFSFFSALLLGIHCSDTTISEWKDLECQVKHLSVYIRCIKFLAQTKIPFLWHNSQLGGIYGWVCPVWRMAAANQRPQGIQLSAEIRWEGVGSRRMVLNWWESVHEVWTHATDGTDVSFFPPRIGCGLDNSHEGDAFLFHLGRNAPHNRGNYCDEPSSHAWKFICEAEI